MRNLPATVTYEQVWDLAVQLSGRTVDNVPGAEEIMLRAFFAAELPDLWRKEAWPELCDFSQVTLTAGVFSKNVGDDDELGDILGVFTLDPRATPRWQRLPASRVIDDGSDVRVAISIGTLWVEFQAPVPDLLDPSLNEADLMASTLPSRFRLPLAFRGAGHLLASEDPMLSAKYQQLAEAELARQAAHPSLTKPYWRTEVRDDAPICGLTPAPSS